MVILGLPDHLVGDGDGRAGSGDRIVHYEHHVQAVVNPEDAN
jgi:hypothetical protein